MPTTCTALRSFAGDVIANLQERLGPDYVDAKLRDLVSGQAGSMLGFLAGALSRVIGGGFALFNVVSLAVVTPVVAFYLLRDWPRVVARDRRLAAAPLCRRAAGAGARGRPHPLRLGARAGDLLPGAGAFLRKRPLAGGARPRADRGPVRRRCSRSSPMSARSAGALLAIGLAFAQFPTWTGVVMVAAVFVLGNLLEGYVIYPRFLGDRVELHAVWVIFALFAGGAAFGFLGVLLAVPVAAVIGVLSRFWLRRYLASRLYLDPPAEA